MRKASFQKSHEEFEAYMYVYGDLLKRLVEARRVVRTKFEKMEILEAFVLRATTRWEILVIDDVITSLNHDSSYYATALGLRLRKHLTRDECKAMLYGHRYLEFGRVGDIVGFGRKYLSPSQNPFLAISTNQRRHIDEFLCIRNMLAHYSDASQRAYARMVREKYNYKRVLEPGQFLLTVLRNGRYRWGDYMLDFIEASENMAASVG